MELENLDPDELLAQAKEMVKACSVAQVGDHFSMAELEVLDFIDKMEEPNFCYTVLKVYSAAVSTLASYIVDQWRKDKPRDLTSEEYSIEVIRTVIDKLTFNLVEDEQD